MDDNDRIDILRAVTSTNSAVVLLVKALKPHVDAESLTEVVEEINKSHEELAKVLERMESGAKNG